MLQEVIRAAYFDYDSDCKIRRKPDSMLRSLIRSYSNYRISENEKLQSPRLANLLFFSGLIDTMFYFPNRFGTIVTLNTQTVAYTTTENALLSLMSIMFKMQSKSEMEFKLRNVYGIYKLYLGSTLIYEAGIATSRLKIYEMFEKQLNYQGYKSSILNGFLAGAIAQQIFTPFFKLHIANHNYKISDSLTYKEFFRKAIQTNQNLFSFFTQNPLSVLMKGGLSGIIYVTLFKKIVELLDDPIKSQNFQLRSTQSQNEKIMEYMNRVQFDNEILTKLMSTGYYQQSDDGNISKNISPYRNILISSFIVSAIGTLIMSPLDLLLLNQVQTRMYGPQSLKKISLRQIYKEIRQTKGLHRIITMVTAAKFIRNLFFVTSFYSAENYLKQQLVKE